MNSGTVYVVVVGEDGRTRTRRYVEWDRVARWIQHHGPGAARCEVYTDAPENGGRRIAVLRRNPQRVAA